MLAKITGMANDKPDKPLPEPRRYKIKFPNLDGIPPGSKLLSITLPDGKEFRTPYYEKLLLERPPITKKIQ
jgi:hypothetical protein